ncbi:hypothetical protein F5Y08DRAFT_307095 [Xylaria arbuscula]|nr:hypothetical protein F5Y08DRAFT_307095 [Xylaria arbuscula]
MSTNVIFVLSFLSAIAFGAPLSTITSQHLPLPPSNFTMPANATIAAINATAEHKGQSPSSHDSDLSTGSLIGIVLGGLVGLLVILWVAHRLAQRNRQ